MDVETLPFQVNLGYQVPRTKEADYVGKAALEAARTQLEAGQPPYTHTLVGLRLAGNPIDEYAPDFWLISVDPASDPVGYVTSPWYSPELETNIAMGHVPVALAETGTHLYVWLPDRYALQQQARRDLVGAGRPVTRCAVLQTAVNLLHSTPADAARNQKCQ